MRIVLLALLLSGCTTYTTNTYNVDNDVYVKRSLVECLEDMHWQDKIECYQDRIRSSVQRPARNCENNPYLNCKK